jgi:oligo-1,6-glucosidase
MYERSYEGERILVICSFSKNEERFRFPKGYDGPGELLLDNYDGAGQEKVLRPYEVRVLRYEVSGDGS